MKRITLVWCASLTLAAQAQQWVQLPDFPGTARDDAASLSINGIIYVGTGMEVGWGLTNDWYAFDTATETWSVIAPFPATPRQYCSAFDLLGKGYLFGGVDANGALNELWCYDPVLDEWTEKAPLPGEGRYACAASGNWNIGQIATGMLASGVPTNEHWHYNADLDLWVPSQPVPGPARHRAAAFSTNAFVIAGGADANGNALSDVWHYEIIFPTGDWVAGPDLPEPRIGAKGVTPHSMIVGGASDGSTFHDDVWLLSNGSWITLPPFSGGTRRGGASGATSGVGGRAYFGTGLGGDLQRQRDWWYLQPQTGIYEQLEVTLLITPNPASQELRLTRGPSISSPFRIVDDLGRSVLTGTTADGLAIDISSLAAGQYVLQVINGGAIRAPFIKLP